MSKKTTEVLHPMFLRSIQDVHYYLAASYVFCVQELKPELEKVLKCFDEFLHQCDEYIVTKSDAEQFVNEVVKDAKNGADGKESK